MSTESGSKPHTAPGVSGKPPAKTLWGYVKGAGPGIVVAMLWFGTGDLVSNAVSGANYGYAFTWVIVVAVVARYFTVSALAKYQLANSQGDTNILQGFGRVWRGYPMLLGISGVLLGFGYNASLLLGSASALFYLTGGIGGPWALFGWAVLVCGITVFVATRRANYRILEWTAIASVLVLAGAFLVALAFSRADFGAASKGLVFGIPEDQGPISALLLVVALIGGVGGSINNLLYTYFMKEKGWNGPEYRKQQRYDLMIGIAGIVVLGLAIWMLAATVMPTAGFQIVEVTDLAKMMELVLGPVGVILLWLGLLGAAYDGYPAMAFGYSKMFVDAVHQTFPSRAARFSAPDGDPIMRWIQIPVLLILPLAFSLPNGPGFIVVTIVANALAVVLTPAIIIGLIWITNKQAWLLPGWRNKWWENAILAIVGVIGIWTTINLVISVFP